MSVISSEDFCFLLEIMIGGRDGKHASVGIYLSLLKFACFFDPRNSEDIDDVTYCY